MRVLLDTATFILAARTPEDLSRSALAALRSKDAEREISAISISEIAVKSATGKLQFTRDEVVGALEDLLVRVLPYRAEHALELYNVPLHHKDPFDRQIIAQAICEDLPVITPDRTFRLYKGVSVIW
jgi:PIN domain nuclease of toxin-antitoxin system